MRFFLTLLFVFSASLAHAQDSETLADIRQELTVLNVEIQKLKRQLSTTGGAGGVTVGASVLERVDAIEAELRRLTAKTEQLGIRVQSIVDDGTRRIADLEFRLVGLEGGDVSQLGETSTLGGQPRRSEAAAQSVVPAAHNGAVAGSGSESETELAIGEAADFKAARAALEAGDYAVAAERLKAFNDTYPGSPVATKAALAYGAALEGQGDLTGAARAYLDAFRREPNGPDAPESLYRLGTGLGRLGQTAEACKTLSEVSVRFPGGAPAAKAEAERARLGCQ